MNEDHDDHRKTRDKLTDLRLVVVFLILGYLAYLGGA